MVEKNTHNIALRCVAYFKATPHHTLKMSVPCASIPGGSEWRMAAFFRFKELWPATERDATSPAHAQRFFLVQALDDAGCVGVVCDMDMFLVVPEMFPGCGLAPRSDFIPTCGMPAFDGTQHKNVCIGEAVAHYSFRQWVAAAHGMNGLLVTLEHNAFAACSTAPKHPLNQWIRFEDVVAASRHALGLPDIPLDLFLFRNISPMVFAAAPSKEPDMVYSNTPQRTALTVSAQDWEEVFTSRCVPAFFVEASKGQDRYPLRVPIRLPLGEPVATFANLEDASATPSARHGVVARAMAAAALASACELVTAPVGSSTLLASAKRLCR